VLSLVPHLAAWGKTLINGALGAAGTDAASVGLDKLGQNGVLYHGLSVLGGGSILGGLVLGAITVFIVERQFMRAAAFAGVGAGLTFFGFIHAEALGVAQTPLVAVSYVAVAAILVGCAKYSAPSTESIRPPALEHGAVPGE